MKTKLFGFVLFFLSVFLFISMANAKEKINTVQTMIAYDDLTQIMKNNVGKYFVLPIDEFEKLKTEKEKNIDLLSSYTPNLTPPVPHIIRSIKVFGRISEKLAFIEADFTIEKLTEGYADIPIFSGKAAVEKAFLNNKPISITSSWKNTDFIYIKNNIIKQTPKYGQTTGYWDKYITTNPMISANEDNNWPESEFKVPIIEKGLHECKINFILPIENNEGLYSLILNLSKSTASFVKFEVPNTVIAVNYTTLSDYSVIETKSNNGCEFIGWAGSDNSINIRWRHKFLQQQVKKEKEPKDEPKDEPEDEPEDEPIETPVPEKPITIINPLVYAHSQTIFSVGQTVVYGQKTIEYSISKAPISKLIFEIPSDVEVTDVKASGQYAQKIIREGNKKKLQIDLMTEQRDRYSIDIFYEQNIKIDSESLVLPEIIPLGIERELGNTAIESLSSSEIQLSTEEDYKLHESVYPIDPIELPAKLKEKAARPIIMAYNHSICPTGIKLSIKRYKEVEQKTVVADTMFLKTTFTTNSTSNTLVDLAIRNNNKQYLQLQLASGAEIISTLRDGKSVKTVNGKIPGTVQIPLEMSRSTKEPISTKLQIMIKEPIPQMKWKGKLKFAGPAIDIPVSKFDWDIFAPENYQLFNYQGTVENSEKFTTPFLIDGFVEIAYLAYELAKSPFILAIAAFLFLLILGIFFEKSFSKFLKKLFSPLINTFKTLFFKSPGRSLLSIMLILLIIAIIYAMSVPNFRKARMQSPLKACMSNMRVITGALEMYAMDNPPPSNHIDIYTLVNKRYLKSALSCREGGTYSIYYPDQVYCSLHGSLEQTYSGAESKRDMVRSKVAKPSASYPQKEYSKTSYNETGFFSDEESFDMIAQESVAPIAPRAPSARKALEEKTRETQSQIFGTTKKTGLLPIKTNLVKTKNYQNFKRDLIIPEGEQSNFTKTNSTYPEVTFYYVLENIVKVINVVAFLLAMLAGLYFVSGSAKGNKFKICVAAIILLLLSIIDIKINKIGFAANSGFWLAIFISFVWKSFMLIRSGLTKIENEETATEKMIEKPTEKPIENESTHPEPTETPTKPDSGKINLILMLILATIMLLAPAITSANTQIASETIKEIRIMAPFKDLSTILPSDGKVVFLSEEDYKYLKDIKTIETPKIPENPHEYVINSVTYIGAAENSGVRFKGIFKLELFNNKWKKIPLLSKNAVTSSATMDKKPQSLALTNFGNDEYYTLVTNESGAKTIEIDFFVKSQENRPIENTFFTLETVTSCISILELTVNKENCDASINPGIIKNNLSNNGKTLITAVIPPTSAFSLEVFNKISETFVPEPTKDNDPEESYDEDEAEDEKIQIVEEPTRVSVRSATLLNFKENFVSGIVDSELNIKGTKGIDSFRFAIPESIHITNVVNTAILENWEEIKENEEHFLELTFKSVIKGIYKIEITFENELKGQKEKEYNVPELIPQNVEQSQGTLGIGCIEDLEINAKDAPEGYSPIASGEFFKDWKKTRTEKLPYAFRYFKHPNKLNLTITRPENIEMLSAVIDKAEAITLVNNDGYIITRVKYKIRNNSEQFLKVKLPDIGSTIELWDSRADANPVSTGYDSKFGTHNLPIVRSQINAGESQAFFAEITYVYKDNKITAALKKKMLELPKVHLPISELLWQVFTPEDSRFLKIEGNLDTNKHDRPEFMFAKDYSTQQNINLKTDRKKETESTGLMPVRFEIPLSANVAEFKMLQIDPSGKAPFIEALIVGPQKKHKNLYMALALLIGFIFTGTLSKLFTSKHKFLWILITLTIGALTAGLMWLNIYGTKFIIQGFITSIMLYLMYKFFAHTPERN